MIFLISKYSNEAFTINYWTPLTRYLWIIREAILPGPQGFLWRPTGASTLWEQCHTKAEPWRADLAGIHGCSHLSPLSQTVPHPARSKKSEEVSRPVISGLCSLLGPRTRCRNPSLIRFQVSSMWHMLLFKIRIKYLMLYKKTH